MSVFALIRLLYNVFGKFIRRKSIEFLQPSQFSFCQQMSSSHQYMQNANVPGTTSSSVRLGEIEHLFQLSENLSSLYMSADYSDVVLIVEGQRLYAHKVSKKGIIKFFDS